jgi:hypothetical protein
MVQTQEDFFSSATAPLAVDRSFSNARRTQLDACSWVERVPGWLSGAQALFELLRTAVVWGPRLTAEYRTLSEVPDQTLRDCAQALSNHYGGVYDNLWMSLYRDGQDSTDGRQDNFASREPECIVPVMSLGATRWFWIKPRQGGATTKFKSGTGDLIVMRGRAQQDWVYSVPKDSRVAAPRISISFRSSLRLRGDSPL